MTGIVCTMKMTFLKSSISAQKAPAHEVLLTENRFFLFKVASKIYLSRQFSVRSLKSGGGLNTHISDIEFSKTI